MGLPGGAAVEEEEEGAGPASFGGAARIGLSAGESTTLPVRAVLVAGRGEGAEEEEEGCEGREDSEGDERGAGAGAAGFGGKFPSLFIVRMSIEVKPESSGSAMKKF